MAVDFLSRCRTVGVAIVLAFATALAGAAAPSSASAQTADVVINDLRLTFGEISYTASRAEFRGTRLTRDDIARIFDQASPEPVGDRVRRLEAASIVLPEIVAEMTTPQGRQLTTYRDVTFSDVSGGRIASMSAAGGTLETSDTKGTVKGEFERFVINELDLDLAVGLFTGSGGPNTPLKKVYGGFSLVGLTFRDPSGTTTRIGRFSGRDLSARPTSAGWIQTMNDIAAAPDMKAASPEARKRSLDGLVELLDSFAIGVMEVTDITFTGSGGDGSGRIGRIGFTGSTASRGAEIRVDGFEAGSKDGSGRFASLSFGGMSAKPMLEAMRDMSALPEGQAPGAALLRKFVPVLGSFTLNGFEFEAAPEKPSVKVLRPTATRVSIGQIELAADKLVENVPSDARLTIRNVAFSVPPNPDNDGLKQIASLGYDRVDASAALSLGWNEAGQEMVLRDLSVDGQDMGRAVIRAVLGNVTRDLFNPDSAVASVAALGATAKSVEITVENRGLFERVIAREAQRQKRNPEDIRREYGMAAAVGIPAMLGNSPAAKTLASAVAKFVAKPGRLIVRARAKGPAGYGVADFAAGPDPASILNAIELTATAE